MELVKRLGCKSTTQSWGIFRCPFCRQKVEKMLHVGRKSKSCGCNQFSGVTKHGYASGDKIHPLHTVWTNMKERCFNPKNPAFPNYGFRGITVCSEWCDGFVAFRDWALMNGYEENLTIDRIDNDGDYEPENCRFVSYTVQSRNNRNAKLTMEKAREIRKAKGSISSYALAQKYGVSSTTILDVWRNKTWREDYGKTRD